MTTPSKPRAIVCGTKFGRIYLKAFAQPDAPFELAGIMGLGSERTMACARRYGVPVFNTVDDVPDDITVACVVVGSGSGGGQGAEIAQSLMRRGIHVLQEHPLMPAELGACLRTAAANGVQYRLNTHYVNIAPVRAFIDGVHRMAAHGKPLFIDATCSIQVAYTLFDILGRALGTLRPFAFNAMPEWSEAMARLASSTPPYRSLEGVIGGIPVTLRIQNQLDADDPDNYSHILHRITVGGAGGTLTLVDTHGPVIWSPRFHLPASAAVTPTIDEATDDALGFRAMTAQAAYDHTFRDILGNIWPAGVARAMCDLSDAIKDGRSPLPQGQYDLVVCELWQTVTRAIGFPDLHQGTEQQPLPSHDIFPTEAA